MYRKCSKKPSRTYVTPKIDNKPPHFDASVYLKVHHLQQDALRIQGIDRENVNLLQKMNIIHRLGGFVNCWAPDIEYKSKFKPKQDRRNNAIMRENRKILGKIRQAVTQYPAREFFEKWKNMHQTLEHHARYPSVIEKLSIAMDMRKQLAQEGRTKCFFDLGLEDENKELGRVIFELHDNVVPRTCENFAALCKGTNGLSYKNTPFHRIVAGYWCQGGDVTKFNGTGGTSIYGDSFDNENFSLRHAGPGVLSMCTDDDGRSDSKFNITFRRLTIVDGKNVVFGRVIGGMGNFFKIEEFGTRSGKPIKSVIVLNCGVLPAEPADEKLSPCSRRRTSSSRANV